MSQRDWMEKDFYKVLGVSPTATKAEIKKAYRKLAQQHHPDANEGDPAAEQRFKEISEAHAILSNDEKRKEYDQMRAFVEAGGQRFYGFGPGGRGNVRVNVGDLGDMFGDNGDVGGLFGDLFGFRSQGPRRGGDLETEVLLAFEKATFGTTVALDDGTRVRIPPGVGDGARIRVASKGQPGPGGGPRGDLFVRVRVDKHPLYGRGKNGEIRMTVPVTIAEAALGTKVTVPTLEGEVTLKIPAGSQNGKVLRVRGHGGPRANGGRGDLLVTVKVEVPERLSKEEREALERFTEVHKATPRAHLDKELEGNKKKAS